MARGAAEPSSKRAKAGEADEEEVDRLVRRKEEVVRLLERARAKGKGNARAKKELLTLCADFEAKNEKLLRRLPPELWQKILDENVQQNDLLALALTCRFFREKLKDLGRKMETNLTEYRLIDLLESGRMVSHSLGWFQWVCDTLEFLPGFMCDDEERVEGVAYEGDLLHYAAFQGSVEILRWLMEEKGCEPNRSTGYWAGLGGSVAVLEYTRERGYELTLTSVTCDGAAGGGCLKALKWLRDQDPPCPWDSETCAMAAGEGQLEVLQWLRAQDPPCPWSVMTCAWAAQGGHLEVLKWARSQDPPCPWNVWTCIGAAQGGQLEVLKWLRSQDPPCPWIRRKCRGEASKYGHDHVVQWIDQQEDESDVEFSDYDMIIRSRTRSMRQLIR